VWRVWQNKRVNQYIVSSTYLSANSIASKLGGGMSMHTDGIRSSWPLDVLTYNTRWNRSGI